MKTSAFKLISVLLIAVICFGTLPAVYAQEDDTTESKSIYLSDISYEKASIGYGTIHYDGNMSDETISVKVDGNRLYFDKGVTAHASSTLIYNLTNYSQYNYFTSYIGVDYSQGNLGNVIFHIYTSDDGVIWNEDYTSQPLTASSESEFVTIDISKAKYLKLYTDQNGSNGNDHSVFADAKLCVSLDDEEVTATGLKTLEEYTNILEDMKGDSTDYTDLLQDTEFEHILLQRKFVKDAGYKTLSLLCQRDEKYTQIISWLLNDYKALKLYVLGGKPNGSYQKSMDVLYDLYTSHGDDINDETYGDLYERMIIALSLTHSTTVYAWQDSARVSNAVNRYEIYKELHSDGLLWNNVFENLTVDEMRWVMFANIDDNEIKALNTYVREHNSLSEFTYENWCGINGYNYITYTTGYQYPEHPSIFDIFEQGAVCGGISKSSVNIRQVFGVPGATVYQPGHCAWLDYRYIKNDGKDAVCYIGNNVSGWTKTHREFDDRMPCGWGNAGWRNSGGYCASYVMLSVEAQNDYNNYIIAEELVYMSDVFTTEAEALCRKALTIEDFNLDAYENLIYATTDYSESESLSLLQEISDKMYGYPLPMWDLTNLLKAKHNISSDIGTAESMLITYSALKNGTTITAENSSQPDVCKTMSNDILNKNSFELASLNLIGEEANVLKLASVFSDNAIMEYSIDAGKSWKNTNSNSTTLSDDEISNLSTDDDLLVRIAGMENYYTIDITKAATPTNLYNNDLENKIMNTTDAMEWSFDQTNWTSFGDSDPDLSGDVTVYVRVATTETVFASDSVALNFTEDDTNPKKSYITIDRLSIAGCSSEATNHNQPASNAIDGNINTVWHSNWTWYSDNDRYIIIELDSSTYLSAVDYVPSQSGSNGRFLNCELYTSLDGSSWTLSATGSNWGNNTATKTINLDTPVYTKFVKLVATSGVNSFASAAMINLYEDISNKITVNSEEGGSVTGIPSGNIQLGETVTLNAVSKDGYTFNGFYIDGEKVSSSSTYTFVYSENVTITASFAENPKANIKVCVVGGTNLSVKYGDDEATDRPILYYTSLTTGKYITLTPTGASGSKFLYWVTTNGKIVSTSESYTFLFTGDITLSAVYSSKSTNSITFISGYNQIHSSMHYSSVEELKLPDPYSKLGYTFMYWSLDGVNEATTQDIYNASLESSVIVNAVYKINEVYYTIKLTNGTIISVDNDSTDSGKTTGEYLQNSTVTFKADQAPDGEKFAYWEDNDGKIYSYSQTYAVYLSSDLELKAVYISEDKTTTSSPTAIISSVVFDEETNKMQVISSISVMDNCTIVSAGLIATDDSEVGTDSDAFTYDNAKYQKVKSVEDENYQIFSYIWTKNNVLQGDTWYLRSYVIYKDENGNFYTFLGDITTATRE